MIVTQKPYASPRATRRATSHRSDPNFGGLGTYLLKKAGNEVGQTIQDLGFIGKDMMNNGAHNFAHRADEIERALHDGTKKLEQKAANVEDFGKKVKGFFARI